MKYLIAGLGNVGETYQHTRHNIGFDILDAFSEASNVVFEPKRYGAVAEGRLKNKQFILLKPSTYMNLSGNAVRYWLQAEKISLENLLVVVDDLALPFGRMRLRPDGGDAGHNGLSHIQESLGTDKYARLRFGIGNDFPQGTQVDYVLSGWTAEQLETLPERIDQAVEIIKSFCLAGIQLTMTRYNRK
ncbi:MAG TPA: aminoacyl-tRNA hydrolase [Bacteroidales bacterium]|nr:aminoacyl-tRNA hydrolase [Bacteroidales bacterium]HPL06816.1 aminoacyl-tRNA hydrolase [Bacteroidales bacterium]